MRACVLHRAPLTVLLWQVEGSAQAVEAVFSTNVTVYHHAKTGREIFKCGLYTVPAQIAGAVDFLVGLHELPLIPPRPKTKPVAAARAADPTTAFIIPGFLRDIYNVPSNKFSAEASLGLIEFLDYASYDKTALGQFLVGTNNPTWSIPANQTIGPFGGDGLESVLDVQVSEEPRASLRLTEAPVWWHDGARRVHLVHHGPALAAGLYAGVHGHGQGVCERVVCVSACDAKACVGQVPQVISMSWGWPSAQMCAAENGPAQCQTMTSQQYSTRVDTEFMKIAARGVTSVGASGDQGAPGDTYYTCQPGLSDIMPGASTWVTGVGATQLGNPSASAAAAAVSKRANPWGAPVS